MYWPPRLVRDLRVRWALEEAGLPYEIQLIGPEDCGAVPLKSSVLFRIPTLILPVPEMTSLQ